MSVRLRDNGDSMEADHQTNAWQKHTEFLDLEEATRQKESD